MAYVPLFRHFFNGNGNDDTGNGNSVVVDLKTDKAVWGANSLNFLAADGTSPAASCMMANISGTGNIGSAFAAVAAETPQTMTIILAIDINQASSVASTVFRFGPVSGYSDVSVVVGTSRSLTLRWGRAVDSGGEVEFLGFNSHSLTGKTVAIFQIDPTQENSVDVVKCWYNATPVSAIYSVPISTGTRLNSINSEDRYLAYGSRPDDGARNSQTELFYGEAGLGLLTAAQITKAITKIAANDSANWDTVNTVPAIDSPNADISIKTNWTGSVDLSTGISDADGDSLSFTSAPDLPTGLNLSSAG